MSYGFDESTSQSSGANIMAPGINENVKLVNVVYEPAKSDGTGDLVLRFNFEDAGGAKFSHVEWAIDEERERSNARQWGKDVEEHLKSRYVAQSERIFHILTTFVPREVLIKSVGKTDSFAAFSQALISALGNNHIDKLRICLCAVYCNCLCPDPVPSCGQIGPGKSIGCRCGFADFISPLIKFYTLNGLAIFIYFCGKGYR